MPVLKYDISKVLGLACLVLIPEDGIVISRDLSQTLDYIDQIHGFGLEKPDHNFRTEQANGRLREDRIKPSLPRTLALGNAPEKDEDFFRVPRVLG